MGTTYVYVSYRVVISEPTEYAYLFKTVDTLRHLKQGMWVL
jgi:hypothetical protein